MELEPKFGQILLLVKPNITAQLLQGSSGARAKIWSTFTTTQAYCVAVALTLTVLLVSGVIVHSKI